MQGQAKRLWEVVLATSYVFSKVRLACASEGSKARKHFVENAAKRPNISRMLILVTIQHFWRHHQRCAKPGRCKLSLFKFPCEAKIGNFDLKFDWLGCAIRHDVHISHECLPVKVWGEYLILGQMGEVHQNIAQFEVTMHHVLPLDSHQAIYQLSQNCASL